MPTTEEMRTALLLSGYRAITLNSFNDLIGGCRYVAIDSGPPRVLVMQVTPSDPTSGFSVWMYGGGYA